ncbi:MAG TPA: DUF3611 family protein [Nostocaceae cyanobacterium]|nr:DUF3611 family protein [Nostocaceae cyanobacterium]
MLTESETHKQVSSKLAAIAKTIRLTGWLTLWVQLALALVSGLALVFVSTGRRFAEQPNPGLGVGIFWAGLGILMLFFSIYWNFRYTRIGRRLANPNPSLHPSKADTLGIIRLGVMAGLIGILFTLLGAVATASVLIAKSISQPPGVAITDPNRIIRALDVFVIIANINGIAAHFIGTITSLWLIERIVKN